MYWTGEEIANFIEKNGRVPSSIDFMHIEEGMGPTFKDIMAGFLLYLQRFYEQLLKGGETKKMSEFTREERAYIEHLDELYPDVPISYGLLLYKGDPEAFANGLRDFLESYPECREDYKEEKENEGDKTHLKSLTNREIDAISNLINEKRMECGEDIHSEDLEVLKSVDEKLIDDGASIYCIFGFTRYDLVNLTDVDNEKLDDWEYEDYIRLRDIVRNNSNQEDAIEALQETVKELTEEEDEDDLD